MNERVNRADVATLKDQPALPAVPMNNLPAPTGSEIGATFAAAQAKAMVEARYLMALRKPRDWDQVRQDILRECRRPAFANNKSAYYVKPIGDGAEGLGIRFAEVALRCATNMLVESPMVYEDTEKEVHHVVVTDLESNMTYDTYVRVSKYVERRKLEDGQQHFGVRKNSYGKPVYTVLGTDDDLLNKRQALISKAIRTLALRIVPGGIQDEAEAIIKQIRLDGVTADPDAERKRIADAFGELNVSVSDLTEHLGHGLATCTPAELVKLRGVYGALRDGEVTWAEVIANADRTPPPKKESAPENPPPTTQESNPPPTTGEPPAAAGGAQEGPAKNEGAPPAPSGRKRRGPASME